MHQILLYYKYIPIENPTELMHSQRALCEKLGLKGRILIAKEGINGTCEGTVEATESYVEAMKKDPRFADIHWKRSVGDGNSFPKLAIKVRDEIVSAHLGEDDFSPRDITGKYLKPDQLHELFEKNEDFVIVDMRNDYEQDVGVFKGSIRSGMKNFRDLPETARQLESVKNKKVVTVCTGGVRCEKASGYLVKKGFKDVYQLDGGIVSYMEKYPGKNFLGSLYVFDKRKVMSFDKPEEHVTIGRCQLCEKPSERYVNCKNALCHGHFICCEACCADDRLVECKSCARGTPAPRRGHAFTSQAK